MLPTTAQTDKLDGLLSPVLVGALIKASGYFRGRLIFSWWLGGNRATSHCLDPSGSRMCSALADV